MSETITRPRVFADRLSPEEKARHFAELGKKSNQHRLTLSHDEVSALVEAYALLAGVAARAAQKAKPSPTDQPDEAAA